MASAMEWESAEQYRDRVAFLEWYLKREGFQSINDIAESSVLHKIQSMAQCYSNVKFLKSIYSDEIMQVVEAYFAMNPTARLPGTSFRRDFTGHRDSSNGCRAHQHSGGPTLRQQSDSGAYSGRSNHFNDRFHGSSRDFPQHTFASPERQRLPSNDRNAQAPRYAVPGHPAPPPKQWVPRPPPIDRNWR
eukprot:Gregarina_sp_Poly_1__6218@NODE_329_length_9477_cov_82_111477_g279_i0_p4_GENE_NODE_329_length_9477_cov_82_111477_g279_i0NODE_329_length_9477_cov_82_111477_g279_i0_p4_ORF_typecomplete_len216_score24_40XTBD/PF11952_8/3_9e06_NODE_329_length_9477_cov_82_111477_g279_i088299395